MTEKVYQTRWMTTNLQYVKRIEIPVILIFDIEAIDDKFRYSSKRSLTSLNKIPGHKFIQCARHKNCSK